MDAQQVENYLKRINYDGSRELTGATLDALVRAHVSSVPFDTLTTSDFHQCPSLDENDLYKKIVEDRRGGYCFEMNTCFNALLQALGFETYLLGVRGAWPGRPTSFITHMAILAKAEGKEWFCDVGFGGPGPKGAMELREGEQSFMNGEKFRFRFEDDWCIIQGNRDGEWADSQKFEHRETIPADFIPLNYYMGANPESGFRKRRTINLTLPGGSKALTDMHYTYRMNGEVTEKDLKDKAELEQLLKDEFGLDVRLPNE